MKRMAGLERYHPHTIHRAYQDVFLSGIELEPFKQSSRFVEAVKQRCKQIESTYHEPRRPRRDSRSSAVRAPKPIPIEHPASAPDAFSRLQTVGTVRGIFVALDASGGYKVTAKLTIAGRGPVYRYGIVQSLEQVQDVLNHWIDKGVWTQDRQ